VTLYKRLHFSADPVWDVEQDRFSAFVNDGHFIIGRLNPFLAKLRKMFQNGNRLHPAQVGLVLNPDHSKLGFLRVPVSESKSRITFFGFYYGRRYWPGTERRLMSP